MSILKGKSGSFGVGRGLAQVIKSEDFNFPHSSFSGKEKERKELESALEKCRDGLNHEAAFFDENSEEHKIIEGHKSIAEDVIILEKIGSLIDGGMCAGEAVKTVYDEVIASFLNLDDEVMRQRAQDIEDVRNRLLSSFGKTAESEIFENSVIVKKELFPSEVLRLKGSKIKAVIAQRGTGASHAAILLREMKIPAVFGVENALTEIKNGDEVIVNGFTFEVGINPNDKEERRLLKTESAGLETSKIKRLLSISSPDIDLPEGCCGVGLFRTEFLFMNRKTAPDEEEQYGIYSRLARKLGDRELIIRTLDIGDDKSVSYLKYESERNPLLGLRGIRFALSETELFKIQIKAILRAGAVGNVRLLLPLISTVEEVRAAKKIIESCKAELDIEGKSYKNLTLGIMVETPSAALISDLLSGEVDFFSIGLNDLTCYVMAADRDNSAVEALYDVFRPAVQRLIEKVIKNAKKNGIPVYACGEFIKNEILIKKLETLGIDGIVI